MVGDQKLTRGALGFTSAISPSFVHQPFGSRQSPTESQRDCRIGSELAQTILSRRRLNLVY